MGGGQVVPQRVGGHPGGTPEGHPGDTPERNKKCSDNQCFISYLLCPRWEGELFEGREAGCAKGVHGKIDYGFGSCDAMVRMCKPDCS